MQFTIIGNPENRRVKGFCESVQQLGYGMPTVISYAGWLSGREQPSIPAGNIVKIDSPGENDAVRSMLVARGEGDTTVPVGHGEIKHMRAWYAGYANWLQQVQAIIQEQSLPVMNNPADILLQFNKPVCQAWLQQQGVPVPLRLPAFTCYDELVEHMQRHGLHKVFIKPAHASSASGVIAFRKAGHRVQAVTSAEMVSSTKNIQLYNSLHVRTYTSETEIAQLINRLVTENVFA